MRVRVRFTKLGQIRWIGHRDVARVWERSLRRAELPVARTEGFSPRPKMSFGLALSTGHESLGEYLDIEFLDDDPFAVGELAALPGRLNVALPEGMAVTAVAEVDPRAPSLQEDVVACRWELVSLRRVGRPECHGSAARGLPVVTSTRRARCPADISPPCHAQVCGPVDGGILIVASWHTPRSMRPSSSSRGSADPQHRGFAPSGSSATGPPEPLRPRRHAPHARARAHETVTPVELFHDGFPFPRTVRGR